MEKLSFEISGEIYRTESRSDNYYDDKELLSILNEKSYNIQREIESELYHYVSKFWSVERIEVQLIFQSGSILATGWVIVNILGSIAGAVSFFEYLNRLIIFIRKVTQRAISSNLPGNGNTYKVSISVTPTGYPTPDSSSSNEDKAFDLFKISPSKLLLSITLINIMLFIGGTLFTTIEVPSILKKYDESVSKFKEAKAQYDSADFMLKKAKLDYQFKQQEIENIKSEVLQKKETILNSLSADTLQIRADITNIDTKLTLLSNQIKELYQNKERYEKSLIGLNESIAKLQENKVTFSFSEVWHYMNLWLRIVVVTVLSVILLTIIFSTIYIIRKIKN